MSSTRISRRLSAPFCARGRDLDGDDRHDQPVHAFDAREGARAESRLCTMRRPGPALVTNKQVVEVVEFETTAPALRVARVAAGA